MCNKSLFLISIVLLLSMAGSGLAITSWTNTTGNQKWEDAGNWNAGVPGSLDRAYINMAGTDSAIIGMSVNAVANRLSVGRTGDGCLKVTGGALTVGDRIYVGYSSYIGTLDISDGTITAINKILIGYTGDGTVNMTGGVINATEVEIPGDVTGIGHLQLDGGLFVCDGVFTLTTGGSCDICGGTLKLPGDARELIAGYATAGLLSACGGEGRLIVDYDVANDETRVTGLLRSLAWNPSPYSGETGVDPNVVLSWSPGDYAASHDVYFGTSFDVVNNTSRLAGDADGDGQVDWFDVLVIAKNWLQDPEGLEPYPDLDGDGSTDLVDFAVVGGDWTGQSSEVFKGNQDANSYGPLELEFDGVYYWRIDEVNGPNTWKGEVWSFETQQSCTAEMRKGPYLIYPGDNDKMTVLWQLDGTCICTLAWGLDTSYSAGSVKTNEYGTDHQHKYTISGLTPATKYYYQVTAGTLNKYSGSFRTALPTDTTKLKFLAYGDTRSQPNIHDSVNKAMVDTFEADPNYQTLTLHSGDWVASDTEGDWTGQFFNPVYLNTKYMQANLPINGCWGNHEGAGVYYEKYWPYPYVSAEYWSFDYGPMHVAVIDQSVSYSTGSAQYNWLVNDLAASTKEWKFIVLHYPGYSAGGHGDNSTVRSAIQPLCEMYGVDIVFAGHNHYYARCDASGIKHITTGGGGAPLYDCNPNYIKPGDDTCYVETCTKAYHFCKITIDGNQLDLVAVKPDGTVIDSFALIH